MKTSLYSTFLPRIALVAAALVIPAFAVSGQGTTFTYQGRLDSGSNPVNGLYELRFSLFSSNSGGTMIGGPLTQTGLVVSNGLFSAALDFGAGSFPGADRWLELEVRSNGLPVFVILTPRQKVTAAPYAITAGNMSGILNAGQLIGSYSNALAFSNPGNLFVGNGGGLLNLDPAAIAWGGCPPWSICGNAGTIAGINFLGTTDNQPLEFKVNGQRALRLEPGTVPNVIGGSSANVVSLSAGVAIGGGTSNSITFASPFATIGGGLQNQIDEQSDGSTIGGGQANLIYRSFHASIGGGLDNSMPGQAERGTIGGGLSNVINHSFESTVAGGKANVVFGGFYAVVGGGTSNRVDFGRASIVSGGRENRVGELDYETTDASVGGGGLNTIGGGADGATVAGGRQNSVATNSVFATIGGGSLNQVLGTNLTIGGGYSNTLFGNHSTIAGGVHNSIYVESLLGIRPEAAALNTISGGGSNSIHGGSYAGSAAYGDTIAGGLNNGIGSRTRYHVIGGGSQNGMAPDGASCTISGGEKNSIDGYYGSIAGGIGNQILNYANPAGSIGGGEYNLIKDCFSAAIGGGYTNVVLGGDYSVIAGGASNLISSSATYAVIPGGAQAKASNFGQLAYAGGQFASVGDAQTSVYVCRGTSVNATPTNLFLDASSRLIKVPANSTWTYDALVTGRTSDGNSAGYQIRGVIENNAGTTALVGAPNVTVLGEDIAAWDATVIADNANHALVVQATGAASATVRWVATVRTVEVSY